MGTRGKQAVAVALLAIGLSAFAYAVQVGQQSSWVATGLPRLSAAAPATPDFLSHEPTAAEWTTAVHVTQARRNDRDVWTVTSNVTMPADSRALHRLRFMPGANAYPIAHAVVGTVRFDGRAVRPTHYVITDLGGDSALVSFTTTTTVQRGSTSSVVVGLPSAATDVPRTVTVTVADYDIVSVLPTEVVAQTPRRVEVRGPLRNGPVLQISDVNVRFRDPSWRDPSFSFPGRLLALSVWTGLLGTAAWLVTYVLLGREEFRVRPYVTLRRAALALVVLHLGAQVLDVTSEAMGWLVAGTPNVAWADPLIRAAYSGPTVLLVALLVVAPPVAVRWTADRPDRPGPWWAACAALACLLAWPMYMLATNGATAAVVAITAAGTMFTVAVTGLVAMWGRLPVAPSCATALATALLATVSALATGVSWVADAITLLPVVTGVATAAGSLVSLGWVTARVKIRPTWRRLAAVALAVACVAAAVPQRDRFMGWYLAGYGAFLLTHVGTAALAAAVAATLYVEVRYPSAQKRVRLLGIAFALLTFSAPTALVTYIPLGFLLSAPLIAWWALPNREGASLRQVDENHASNVAAVLRARPAERSAYRLRRALRTKVENGDLTDAECENQVRALVDVAIQARDRRPDLERAAFGSYLVHPPREAAFGAVAGLIAGLPWVLLGARGVARIASFGPFPVLTFTTYTYYDLARWTAYGFLFGACFPLIRGRTGLAKGWTLFLTTAPVAVAVALARNAATATERARLAVVVAELFLHFMVLGLLADLAALKRADRSSVNPSAPPYGVARLVDVHNFRSVVAWGTGVTVAFGTALSTAIVTGATAFVVGVLQPQDQAPQQPIAPSSTPVSTQVK